MAALLLFLGVLLVYWPLYQADYLNYDDPIYIELNRRLDQGITVENLGWAFTANLTHFSPSLEYWSPLTALSRLADVAVWGKYPGGHHFTSVGLHGLSAVLLFGALRLLTGRVGVPLVVAAVFAFHPVVVEPVAWLSARKDVICGLNWNLTLLAYAAYLRRPGRRGYLLTLGAFLLAAMSKPMVLTLPCVLLLLDLWPGNRLALPGAPDFWERLRQPLLEKLPMLAVSVILAGLAMYSQRSWGAVAPAELLPLAQRVANALYAYWEYLRLLAWPAGLSPYHPFVSFPGLLLALGCALGLVGVTLAALWQARRRPWLLVGWLWFCGVLLPVSGLIQIGPSRLGERYLYTALPGIALGLLWNFRERGAGSGRLPRVVGAGALVLALGVVTHQRAGTWQSGSQVFAASTRAYPLSPVLWQQLGNASLAEGRYQQAGIAYVRALELDPQNSSAQLGLARLFRLKRDYPRALHHYTLALATKANFNQAQLEGAAILVKMGKDAEAEALLAPLLARVKFFPEAWRLQAGIQYRRGDTPGALASMENCWAALRAGM